MFGLGYQELLLILVIVLILFGAQRLPDLARSLGSSVKEFKKGVSEVEGRARRRPRRRTTRRRRSFPPRWAQLLRPPRLARILFLVVRLRVALPDGDSRLGARARRRSPCSRAGRTARACSTTGTRCSSRWRSHEFDVVKHQPHPPGYILYVALGRLAQRRARRPDARLRRRSRSLFSAADDLRRLLARAPALRSRHRARRRRRCSR